MLHEHLSGMISEYGETAGLVNGRKIILALYGWSRISAARSRRESAKSQLSPDSWALWNCWNRMNQICPDVSSMDISFLLQGEHRKKEVV